MRVLLMVSVIAFPFHGLAQDYGGPLGERLVSRPRVVSGICYSACVLDAIRPGSCLMPDALLGVHQTSAPIATRVYRDFIAMDAPRLVAWLDRRRAFDSPALTYVTYHRAVSLGVKACPGEIVSVPSS